MMEAHIIPSSPASRVSAAPGFLSTAGGTDSMQSGAPPR
jgi:hypothetical protein